VGVLSSSEEQDVCEIAESLYSSAMPHLQRAFWNGVPERLPDAFTLTKQKGDAT
jgi:hypothetical protein